MPDHKFPSRELRMDWHEVHCVALRYPEQLESADSWLRLFRVGEV
jgi:hypothetical protein